MKSPGKRGARAQPALIYSTSEARANFAEALETAQRDGAVIGFDRYGRTVAALAPIEAVYMLAGRGDQLAPSVRERIERSAKTLVQDILRSEPQPRVARTPGKRKRRPET